MWCQHHTHICHQTKHFRMETNRNHKQDVLPQSRNLQIVKITSLTQPSDLAPQVYNIWSTRTKSLLLSLQTQQNNPHSTKFSCSKLPWYLLCEDASSWHQKVPLWKRKLDLAMRRRRCDTTTVALGQTQRRHRWTLFSSGMDLFCYEKYQVYGWTECEVHQVHLGFVIPTWK